MSEPTIPHRLQRIEDQMLYTYVGRCPFDGLLRYRWGEGETYEVTLDEVQRLIADGWWQAVPTPSAGDEREGATTK